MSQQCNVANLQFQAGAISQEILDQFYCTLHNYRHHALRVTRQTRKGSYNGKKNDSEKERSKEPGMFTFNNMRLRDIEYVLCKFTGNEHSCVPWSIPLSFQNLPIWLLQKQLSGFQEVNLPEQDAVQEYPQIAQYFLIMYHLHCVRKKVKIYSCSVMS